MMSAITYMDELGWYSNFSPGSQLSRHAAKRSRRFAWSRKWSGMNGACGKPAVCVKSCSITTSCLPFARELGHELGDLRRTSSLPSWISSQAAAEVIALVDEKTQ